MKKKVLFIATMAKSHIYVFHRPYLTYFQESDYEVDVFAYNDFDQEILLNVHNFYNAPFSRKPLSFNNLKVILKLYRVMKNNNYDIVHCHTPIGGIIGRLVSQIYRKKGLKVYYTAHGFHFYKGAPLVNWMIYYPIEKIFSKVTDVLITITKEDYVIAKKKFQAKQTFLVNGVGLDLKSIPNNEKLFNNREEKFVILSVGELNVNKNHKSVIEALSKLGNKKIEYRICGKGDKLNELQILAKKLNVDEQVKFLGYLNNLEKQFIEADLFILPSLREGLSVSLMQAMAYGVPVIGSNIRGNSTLIETNKGGFLFNSNDSSEIAKQINRFVNDKKLCLEFGLYNKKKIENFSLENVLDEMRKIYSINMS